MSKYVKYYQEMIDENRELFDNFMDIHDKYSQNKKMHQDEFNKIGREVMNIVRDREDRLCSGMSRSYSQFSHRLADKFKDIIKKDFPLIDFVGVKIE